MATKTGLSHAQIVTARRKVLRSCRLALTLSNEMQYSEGPGRWSGIAYHRRAYKGQVPLVSDCSAFATWVLWDATLSHKPHDFVNGQAWKAGYTGTMLEYGVDVGRTMANFEVGDLVIYDGHVAVYVGGGNVVSHGSPGAHLLPWKYRSDVVSVRRYLR